MVIHESIVYLYVKQDVMTEDEEKPKKEPIFIERGDGLGWTLNFYRPVSYIILFGILAAVLATIIFI